MQIYSYNIPLTLPAFSPRQGLILQTEQGFGECSPLPNFSRETLNEALSSFSHLPLTPAAQFGLSSASLPFPNAFPNIPLSALAFSLKEAENAISQGFKTIKLKVGHLGTDVALEWISALQKQRPAPTLRIDLNRRWNKEQVTLFLERLDPSNIEYIEEPGIDPLPSHLPIALDESLLSDNAETRIKQENVKALILKPTLLGDTLNRWIKLGLSFGKSLIFSSSFESAIGLLHIAHLHAKYSPHLAVGLDTYRFFETNFLPFPVNSGKLGDALLPSIDMRCLKLVSV